MTSLETTEVNDLKILPDLEQASAESILRWAFDTFSLSLSLTIRKRHWSGKVEQIGTPEEVYHHPANAFVYNFLGNVNLFHSRVEQGKAYLGELPIDIPVESARDAKSATVFVRPHLLEIEHHRNGGDNFRAKVTHINAAGPLVKVELMTDWGASIHAEISHGRYSTLALKRHDEVFVRPKERKVFVEAATEIAQAENV